MFYYNTNSVLQIINLLLVTYKCQCVIHTNTNYTSGTPNLLACVTAWISFQPCMCALYTLLYISLLTVLYTCNCISQIYTDAINHSYH